MGCHRRNWPMTSAGRRPKPTVIAGMMSATRYAAALAIMIALIAGVTGPGPKEDAKLDVEGERERIRSSLFQLEATEQHPCPRSLRRPHRTHARRRARVFRSEVARRAWPRRAA